MLYPKQSFANLAGYYHTHSPNPTQVDKMALNNGQNDTPNGHFVSLSLSGTKIAFYRVKRNYANLSKQRSANYVKHCLT